MVQSIYPGVIGMDHEVIGSICTYPINFPAVQGYVYVFCNFLGSPSR